jgi:starvation-inducible outer membrane lipoprotein
MERPMRIAIIAAVVAGGLMVSGCASGPSQSEMAEQRQQQALSDPMNYSPSMDNTDITGGGDTNYDAKAMQRDIYDFWNP